MEKDAYARLLNRIIEYRNQNHISQKTMGEYMGITQSHYNKVESGKKIVSYSALLNLKEHKFDIDYIVTGVRYKESILNHYLRGCRPQVQSDMLAHIIWVIKQGVRITNTKMPDKKVDYNNVMAFLQMRANDVAKEETVWKSVRKLDGRTQNEMAEELNVGIKKYRNIENGNAQPDAQILSELYDKLGYFPSILMPEYTVNLSYINDIWAGFDEELKGELIKHIRDGYDLVNKR
jgi:transcriptional regulator with XRE-family HTH domain